MIGRFIRRVILTLGWLLVGGTLLSFLRTGSWIVRVWDFPRLQIASVGAGLAAIYGRFFFRGRQSDSMFLAASWWCPPAGPLTPLGAIWGPAA